MGQPEPNQPVEPTGTSRFCRRAFGGAVNFFPNRPDKLGPLLTVSGVVSQPEEFLHWAHCDLRVGDRVEIRVVDATRVDKVISRDRPGHASCPAEPGGLSQ